MTMLDPHQEHQASWSWLWPEVFAVAIHSSGSTAGFRRYSSSRADAWWLQLLMSDLGWVPLWWRFTACHILKLLSAHVSCMSTRERSVPSQQRCRVLPGAALVAGPCVNYNAKTMTQDLWDLLLMLSVILWGSTSAQLITFYNSFLLVICRSNFQDCPWVPN